MRAASLGFGVSLACATGVVAMAFPGRPEPWPVLLMRRSAAMTAWAAASVYASGFFAVLPDTVHCVRDDGSVYSGEPAYGWMNRASASLALAAAVLAIGAGCAMKLRARESTVAS
ncbi:hypothetical protein KEF29_10245 [Streptomyces tuirus]|uniref:Uncharacterized protein n=1 Tax=Streptomyces tuirus TaxID=68278 RepID=A0A941FA57_9ACTN|nr:hypothetical protein [Streptomyces tuirus]